MKTNKKQIKTGILLAILILFFSGNIYAFAVSSAYYHENPLYILPGDTKNIQIILQNLAGSEDINVKAEVMTSSDILELTGPDTYLVPAGKKTSVNFKITIPNDAKTDQVYPISIDFITITPQESGSFGFGTSIGQKFDVIIGTGPPLLAPEEKPTIAPWRIGLGIAVVIIIIIIILIRRKKKH